MKKILMSLILMITLSLHVSPVQAHMTEAMNDDTTKNAFMQVEEKEDSPAIKAMLAAAHIGGILTWIALMAFLSTGTLFFYRELKRKK